MNAKIWYYWLTPLVGFLFLFGEIYFEKVRFNQLSELAIQKLKTDLKELQNKLEETINEDQILYALDKRQLSLWLYEEFSKLSPMVEGWALYFPNGKIFAGQGLFFPKFIEKDKIPALPSQKKRFLFLEEKWYLYTALGEDAGFLLLSLNIPKLHPKADLAIFHPLQMGFYLPQNFTGKKNFLEKLKEKFTRSPNQAHQIDTEAESFLVTPYYWHEYSLYLLSIILQTPLYSRFSFYLFLLSLLFTMNFWLSHYWLQKKPKNKLEKTSAQILDLQKEAVDNLRKALDQVTTWDIPRPVAQAEYAYSRDTEEVQEFSLQEEKKVIYKVKEPLVIEVIATKKEFLFPEIDEEVPAKTPIETKKLEKLRQKAFTPEVMQLFEEIKSVSLEPQISKTIESICQKKIEIDSWLVFLNEIYFDEITQQELNRLLIFLAKNLKADALAFLSYNPYLGCYQTTSSHGLDSETKTKLYLLSNDSVFVVDKSKNVAKKISYLHKKNPFFKKRFSENILKKLNAYLAIPLYPYQVRAYLLAFYFEENSQLPQTELNSVFHKNLKEVVPALKYFLADTLKANHSDQVSEFLKEMRLLTGYGQRKAIVLHIFFPKPNYYDLPTTFEKLKEILAENERCLMSTPYHLIFLLSPEKDISTITNLFPESEIRVFHFPERGVNYLAYF